MGPGVRRDDEDRVSRCPNPRPPTTCQRERWTRHDAHLWIRPDFARWLKPGTDPAEVYPELKRQREAAEDIAFEAQIAASQRVLTMLRAEVDEMKAAQARRRLKQAVGAVAHSFGLTAKLLK